MTYNRRMLARPNPRTCKPRAIRRPAAAVVAAVLGAVVLSACGSGSSEDASPKSTSSGSVATPDAGEGDTSTKVAGDGCDLLSDDVVAEVLGVKSVQQEPSTQKEGSPITDCTKSAGPMDDQSYVAIYLSAASDSAMDQTGETEGYKPVAGLGDRAYYRQGGTLAVSDGTHMFSVTVIKSGGMEPVSQQECVKVAQDVLGNLG